MPLVAYALGTAILVPTVSEYMVIGLIPALVTEFGVSFTAIGYLATFYAGATTVGGPLLTTALPRVSRKGVPPGLITLLVVGQIIDALAPGYAATVVARLITAVAATVLFGVALTTYVELVKGSQFGRVLLLVLGGLTVSIMLGLPVTTWLGEWYSWRASFFVVALVMVLVGLLVLQLMPATPGLAGSGSSRKELKVFRNVHPWWIYATSLLLIGVTFAGFAYFVSILTEASDFSTSTVPLLLMIYGPATLVGNSIVGRLADRHTITILAFSLLTAIAMMVAFALFGQVPTVAATALAVIDLIGVSMNLMLVTRGIRVGHNNMLANSVHTAYIMLGVTAGSWIGGLGIADGFGLRGALWVGAALGVLALLALLLELRFAHVPMGGVLGR